MNKIIDSRKISDNEFQKVKWKQNKIKFNSHLHNFDEIVKWIELNTTGKWHYKENWVLNGAHNNIVITFWFELAEDTVLFKLYWLP